MELFWSEFESSWGSMLLVSSHRGIIKVTLPDSNSHQEVLESLIKKKEHIVTHKENIILYQCKKQLEDYFEGICFRFNLPLSMLGTDFQVSVWKHLQLIPFGETWSYKTVAKSIGNEKASRAVGNANNKNPLPLLVPCHRVIGENGKLTGFAGGLTLKQKLLDFEKNLSQSSDFRSSGRDFALQPSLRHITPQH